MDNILKLMPEIIRLSGNQEEVCEKAIYATWNTLVGEQIRRNSIPFKLFKKTLFVAAKDATWRKQLEQMSGQFLFKLNSALGVPLVTHLEFRTKPALFKNSPEATGGVEFHNLELHEAEVADDAASIKDEDLRQAFLRAAGKCLDRAAE
jgi:Zn-ribbon-containing, possibly RNA-binding protein and truncated derivatives